MSASAARVVFRCGAAAHSTALSRRDVGLLDGQHFLVGRGAYRDLFGLDCVRGRGAPHIGQVLVRHPRLASIDRLEGCGARSRISATSSASPTVSVSVATTS